ncbi:conjugative transposon protein TraB [Aquipluma nitroreducens]|uniref:Conjugative transposon protein TraB n=1 Tax=Aquipluma nitroreducens TaxID=2010828 RepID=A0A5K7S3M5_9BACT|nr:DUF3408 domain-containing protein [Aquipluma nitroreducens]BBE16126.1 conjugative transposon protein TraB [Aquipluma nitroreducens]
MATNKNKVEGIDELLLLSSIKEKDVAQIQPVEQSIQENEPGKTKEQKDSKRKRTAVGYSATFLQKNEIKTRQCVYISQRIHATISEIVRVIADKDVSVGGYIDNVLLQHLEAHKEEINELYKKDRRDLIE